MRKLFKQSILVAAVLVLCLTGCASDPIIPDTPDSNHEKRTIVLSVGQATDTRSINIPETPQIEHNRYLDFRDGILFLVDESGNIVQHYTIGGGADYEDITVDAETRRINRSVFTRTHPNHSELLVLTSVSSRVKNVVIIGNPATTLPVTGNINTIIADAAHRIIIGTQQHPHEVNLFGSTAPNGLTRTQVGDRYILTGALTIDTSVARFEITSIYSDCADILSFTIDGIFIDNHFQNARIDLTGIDGWNARSTVAEHYDPSSDSFRFLIHSWFNGNVKGNPDPTNNNRPTARPAAGRAWGYQVFVHQAEATPPPGIVVRLRDVVLKTDAEPLPDTHRFLTFNAFVDDDGDPLGAINTRRVYRVQNLVFNRRDLLPEPNPVLPPSPPDPGVDIGNIRWAISNVDQPNTFAPYPHSAGRLFQWGTLNGETHHWPATGAISGWNTSTNRVAWTADNHPCPAGWRLPTRQELLVLFNTNSDWHSNWDGTGVAGRVFPAGATAERVTGTSPTAIFLPAVGHRQDTAGGLFFRNIEGEYWSSTLDPTHPLAYRLIVRANNPRLIAVSVVNAFSVRCVQEIAP